MSTCATHGHVWFRWASETQRRCYYCPATQPVDPTTPVGPLVDLDR